jgi:hypothetical protein
MDSQLQEIYLEMAEAAYLRSMEDLESADWEHVETQGSTQAFKKNESEGTDVLKIELLSSFTPDVLARFIFENSAELTMKSGSNIEFCRELHRSESTALIHSRFNTASIVVDPREAVLFLVYLELDDGVICITGCSVDYAPAVVSSDAVRCEVKNCIYLFEPSFHGGSSVKFLSKTDIGGNVPDSLVNSMISTAVESIVELFKVCERVLGGGR